MGNWTRTKAAGLLVAAAGAVYSDGRVHVMASDVPAPSAPNHKAAHNTARRSTLPATEPVAAIPVVETNITPTLVASTQATMEVAAADPAAEIPTVPIDKATPIESIADTDVKVTDTGLVEMHVNEANLGEVLRMLSVQLERNVMASKEVHGSVTANLYDVTVKEALDAILRANDCGYREKGNVIFVYTKKELEQLEKDERKVVTETFRIYYTPASNAVNMIKPVLSSDAQVSFTTPALQGIESGGKDLGGNSHATEDTIVITDYPDRLEQVRKVLKEVDRRPQQILVEAVILRASLNESNELGVDFTALGGVDFSNLTGAVGGQIGTDAVTGALADKGFAAAQSGGNGLKIGVVTNNVSVFVNALEGVTDTSVVANPKVLVLNKQAGEVHVGARLGYRTAVSTETLTADDVKFLEIGTRLNFRPYIGDDGYIRMEIKPSDSSGSVSATGLPSEFVTEVTTNVLVRDGRTIVIGGLFRESSDTTRSQVPFLGNLPIAGPLFRKQKDATIREEVIILLTPHIIKDEDAFAATSEAEMRQVDRMRVGVRKGMMPWGRERLAESAYEKATEELKKPAPDRKKALWHLDCATNLNPKFAEAIAMKAQLTGEEVTDVDNSTVRSFVRRSALADRRIVPTTRPIDSMTADPAKLVSPGATTRPTQAAAHVTLPGALANRSKSPIDAEGRTRQEAAPSNLPAVPDVAEIDVDSLLSDER